MVIPQMIRWVETRLIIEKPLTHEKYYPTVLSATTQKSYPFSISYADIEISSNIIGSTSSYISQFRFDDIVRLQVSVKMNPNEKTIWQDIFEGRIINMKCEYAQSNNVKIYCYGHEAIAETSLITGVHTYASSTDARAVLADLAPLYVTRLTYSASYADTGELFPTYDTTANQTYMSDLFSDMEKVASYQWAIKAVPTYTSDGNLSTVYIQWKAFPTVATDKYKVIEGTHRLLSADFSVEGKDLRTFYRVNGDTPSGASQYTGSAEDAALSTLYGKRSDVDTQNWVKSNTLCASIASGILAEIKTPEISGQVELLGTAEAQLGDLVYCKIPSIDLNGSYVSGNFTVHRVQHKITENEFTTSLDLEKVRKTAFDYVNKVATVAKTCKKNQVK
jgi:hypothetical protein